MASTYPRTLLIISFIVLCGFLLTKCMNSGSKNDGLIRDLEGNVFAGSASCASCHKDIYESHIKTAHYLTSQPASDSLIKGSFKKGENVFAFSPSVAVVMEERRDSFYQVEYLHGQEKTAQRFDIVIGSGTKGQSYLWWKKNRLFQLPITYFTALHQWTNSPGYPGRVVFNRPITSRCLECHTTYAEKLPGKGKAQDEFDQTGILYGVDCEKCHGPSAGHVEYHSQRPGDTGNAKYIINPSSLTRQQNLDLCMLCHGGRLTRTKPSFSYQVGDKLTDYFIRDTIGTSPLNIDVHGNQYGLLQASKCFKASEMDCGSCHNVHENEKGNIAVFSQRCLSCHSGEHKKTCKMTEAIGPGITRNCIDCHMPAQQSHSIAVMIQGSSTPTAALLRTHFIKIYPEESKKTMSGVFSIQENSKEQSSIKK
ncbi:MAG TPA: multiheme c-type cytochrome [Chitinophagaceae bacterium]|nr:multiheme c-type cytochrome [Chitinophagaceae bacterium]